MANNIQVLVNTGNPDNNKTVEVLQGSGKRGKPTTIKAVKGARYQLEEQTAKNTAPENIRSKRVGKNLHVMLNGSKEADLIIENYYDEEMLSENNRGLYGRAEDGKIYEYIPEDPTREGMPINLADGGRPVSQVLGGLQVGEAFELSGLLLAAAGGGFSALTAGAAVVGGAALAGGGGGGGGAGTDPAVAALASIKAAAENNTATSGNLAASVFTAAGVTGVDASNLAAIQSALDTAAVNGNAADTKEEVQAIVDAYNAIKANADGTANNNATNPTQAQYAAIGVTGVDTATEESLLGDAIDGKPFSAVDTVAEVQTLANAASAVMTGAAGGTAPTKAQLEALGITGVTDANLSAIQAAIAATPDNGTGVDTLGELQAVANTGATNAANAAAALSAIAAAAQANNATDANVATSVFATAGVTGVDSTNVAAIQSALNSAAVVGTSADTLAEVQAIVDAYNAIKANADGAANNNATNPTAAQYAAIGVTGVDSNVKTSLLGDVVDAKPFSAVDTVSEVQALADAAAAVMTAAAGPTSGNAPTRAQLEALGITGVTDANLQYVQDSIARTADDGIGVDTLAELQAVVTIGIDAAAAAAAAAAAIAAISAAAQANNATDANVAASVFATAGVTGVDSTNVAAIQSALNSAAVNGLATDTLVEIQNIVNAYNAIRENADGTANNYASNPTQADYALIGVTGVDTATEESLLGDAIDGKPFSAVDSVPEVQALANAAAAVMTGAAGGAAPTKAQLEALGITGVTDANLAAVLAAIAATPDNGTGVDTLSELQAVATAAAAAAAALDAIKTAAEGNTATSGNLAASVFTAAGVTGVDADNLAAIQSALDSAAVNGAAADTKAEVQAIVDAYNAIKANADGIDNNNTINPTQAQYAAIGVTGVSSAPQESLLGDAIDGKPFSAVDTVAEVQALADAAAAVMTGAAGGTAPTLAQLQALGITGVTPANLAAVQAAIAANTNGAAGVDTLSELQAITDAATATAASAAALDLIKNAAEGNTAGTTPSLADFVTAGITGVDGTNFAAINSALNSAAVNGLATDTKSEVQAIVDAYKAIKDNADNAGATNATYAQYTAVGVTGIDNTAKANLLGDVVDGKDFADVDTVPELQALATAAAAVVTGAAAGTAPTLAQLQALGITGVTAANLSAIQAAIAATPDDGTGVDTLNELQTLVNNAAAALTAIKDAAQTNNATDANVAISVFAAAGVTGVDANNVGAIQSALNSAGVDGSKADTKEEVQAIVDAYNAIKANADNAATANATTAQYAAIGVTGVDTPTEESLLGDVVDSKAFTDVDTVPELQALATAAAAVVTGAAAGTAPTLAQLQALGITGVTAANLSAIQAAIAATPDDGTGVDSVSELQNIVNAIVATTNHAPTGTSSTIPVLEDGSHAFQASDFGFVDATDTANALQAVIITTLPAAGTLKLNGTAVTQNQSIAVADLGRLVFAPAANANGNTYTTIGFKVQDNGGTANGGVDTSTSDYTLTIDVTAVNDAPVIANVGNTVSYTERATGVVINSGLTVSDVDTASLTGATVTIGSGFTTGDVLAFTNANSITGTYNSATGVLTLTGTATVAQYQAALGSVTYSSTSHNPTATSATRTINWQVDDGQVANHASNVGTSTINVTAVNDPAVISGTTTGAVVEASGVANAIAGTPTVSGTITSADADGTTNLFTAVTAGTASTGGKGTYAMTTAGVWTYTVDNTNATVQALAAGASTTDTFTVTAADGTPQVVTVTINGANDAAVISGTTTGTVVEAGGVANATAGIPTVSGTLTSADIDGTTNLFNAVTAGTASTGGKGTYAMTTAGVWTYTVDNNNATVQALGANASTTDTFSVTAADGTAQVVTVTITGTNDAPTGAVTISGTAQVGQTLTAAASTVADVDGLGALSYSWYANGTVISGATGSTYTLASGDLGKTITAQVNYTDGGGTAEHVTSAATTAVASAVTPGQASIDLGSSGTLIKPYQIEGKWYYYWDRSGDGAASNSGSLNGGLDYTTYASIKNIFVNDINGNVNPNASAGTTDIYRYATINGIQFALPTANGALATPSYGNGLVPATSASGTGTTNNSVYDDLLAVWDAFNGAKDQFGYYTWASGWIGGSYWAANASPSGYAQVSMGSGSLFDASATTDTGYVALQLVTANAAPVLDATQSPTLTGVSASAGVPTGAVGDLVSSLVSGTAITDTDSGASKGIAITGVHAGATLYYSVDGGTTWLTATSVSNTNALLLAADSNTRVYYKANGTSGTITDAITFRAWDMTQHITEGVYVNTSVNGGKAEFSTATDTVSISVTDPLIATIMNIEVKVIANPSAVGGVFAYITGTPTPGTGDTTTLHNATTGAVVYTSPGWAPGASSLNFTGTSFASGDKFYVQLNTAGGQSYRLKNSVVYNGPSSPATQVDFLTSPLVLDLNGDGVQTTDTAHGVQFDLSNSGTPQHTSWVEKHDGLLAIDLNGDGRINSGAELLGSSTQLANGSLASDGWAALGAMDTNGDGKVDAQDANFDKLRVWVDANGDGVTDAGELKTLADVHIASFNVAHDSSVTQQNGNVLQGVAKYTTTDGVTHDMADAWLQATPLSVMTLSHGASLDLSNVSNLFSVTGVNMSADTAANTVKLTLADVLSVATDASIANGVHKLTLTGDANDTVELDLSQWVNTGTTVTEGDHTYAVYNAAASAAAQLLIDQHMVLANHG